MNKTQLKGYLMTISAGFMWGFSDSCGQYLFSRYDLSTAWLTVLRMIIAGTLLSAINLMRHPAESRAIFSDKKDTLQLLAFGVLGLMLSQFTTFQAIRFSNAGTATVLQSLSPAIILIFTCLAGRRLPRGIEALAVFLAVLGTWLLATHCKPGTMALSPSGLVWGLLSASTAALYTLVSRRLVNKYGAKLITGYGLLAGGISMALVTRIWTQPLAIGPDGWLAVGGTILFGTVFAYTLYVGGCARIGAVKGSLLAMLEPVTATIIAVLWMGSHFEPVDLLGFACIFGTVTLLTLFKSGKSSTNANS